MTRLQRMHAVHARQILRSLPWDAPFINESAMLHHVLFGTPDNPVVLTRANVVSFIIDVGYVLNGGRHATR